MNGQFAPLMKQVAQRLLGEPNPSASRKGEMRYGSRGSLSVDLEKGTWFDFETNEGGGVIDLVTREVGIAASEVPAWLRELGLLEPDVNGNGRAEPQWERPTRKIVATYDYRDENGTLISQQVRFDPKDFRQRRPDAGEPSGWTWKTRGLRRLPYRLPDLIEALGNDRPVFIVEGEKDADNLWRIGIPATTNAGGAGKWHADLNAFFLGADVIIIPDNDPQKTHPLTGKPMWHPDGRPILPGQDHAQDIAAQLIGTAGRVRMLDLSTFWLEMPSKGDVSDWIEAGGTADQLWAYSDQVADWSPDIWTKGVKPEPGTKPPPTVIFPFPIDEETIPVRDWIIPGVLMRRHITVLVAPSGSGKSLLTLQVGMSCALGTSWAGWYPRRSFRVLFINSEDDIDEMRRRLAAAARVMPNVDQEAIRDRIALVDSSASGSIVARVDQKTKTLVQQPLLDQLAEIIKANAIDIVFVDPFAETFEGDENSNSELKWAGWMWREVARKCNVALCLVHHTKKYATGMAGDVDAARGAGALIGIARIVSTLFPMTEREAEVMLGKDERERHNLYLRYDDAKANLNLKSSVAKWFCKQTFTLNNKTEELPGDDVGVLVPWRPAKVDVLEAQIFAFFEAIDKGIVDQDGLPTDEYYTFDKTNRAGERSVVTFAQKFFGIVNRDAAKKMINEWEARKPPRLEQIEYRSKGQRKTRNRVISELNPLSTRNKPPDPPVDGMPDQTSFNL